MHGESIGLRVQYRYRLCGWRIVSDLPLTGLHTSKEHADPPDVKIHISQDPSPIENAQEWVDTADNSFIRVRNVADFEVSYGREIWIWPMAEVDQRKIEIYLFGHVWGVLCHQRDILPLHASAIAFNGGVVAFAGHSGAGKSTTAALLNSAPFEVIADDILPISLDGNLVPGAWPYLRRLKLKNDCLTHLGFNSGGSVGEAPDDAKYYLTQKSQDDIWRKLQCVYLLEKDSTDSHVRIERLSGAEAVSALVNQTYRLDFILGNRRLTHHFALCTKLASRVMAFRVQRPQHSWKELKESLYLHIHRLERDWL